MKHDGFRRGCCMLLALLLAVLTCGVQAESASWTCPVCGTAGNHGNFCPECGSARPTATVIWTCTKCGQTMNTGKFCTNCGAPAPSQEEAQSTEVNEQLEQIPGETNRVKVCLCDVTASSFITNKSNPSLWVPENAADGDESTCWQFSSKKSKLGETTLELFIENPETVDEIWFKNGFWAYNDQGGDEYPINARPKDIRVEIMHSGESRYRDSEDIRLEDDLSRSGWQIFRLGRHEDVVSVRLTILSAYKGSAYPNDVCLSEVMLVQEAPSWIAKEPQETKTATVYESRPEVTGCTLNMKLATRSGPGTQFDETGTFFPNDNWQNVTVKVLGKQHENGTWWVLVDFNNGGKGRYRVWTGLKRVNVDLNKVKEYSYGIGQGTVDATRETYRGPGGNYAKAAYTLSEWVDVVALARENGYVEVEFWYEGTVRRVWVPEKYAHIDWGADTSGEN